MCGPATIDTYGGVLTDEQPVANPTTEQSAAFGTRQMENNAQMTRTSVKAWVIFPTVAAAAPQTPLATAGRSQMGVAGADLPTIAKTATGRYTVTYPASWVDALGAWGMGVVISRSRPSPSSSRRSIHHFASVCCPSSPTRARRAAICAVTRSR